MCTCVHVCACVCVCMWYVCVCVCVCVVFPIGISPVAHQPIARKKVATEYKSHVHLDSFVKTSPFNYSPALRKISFSPNSDFTQSAVEIYRTPYITVTNCTFTNNTSYGKGMIRASGNAGAMSIGYDETFSSTMIPTIMISDCKFISNSARANDCIAVDTVLTSKQYTQRGGAVACYFAAGIQVTLGFERCSFTDNYAQDSGGGVYINLSGNIGAVTNITFTECTFVNNEAIDGGGIETTFDLPHSVLMPSSLTVLDCHFENNMGRFGGGIKAIQISSQGNLNRVWVERCTFVGNRLNVGAAIHMQSLVFDVDLYLHTDRIVVKDW